MMPRTSILLPLVMLLVLSGCVHDPFQPPDGRLSTEDKLKQASQRLEQNPTDRSARIQLENQKYARINQLFVAADNAYQSHQLAQASQYLEQVLALDAGNPRAQSGLSKIAMAGRHENELSLARQALATNQPDKARTLARKVLVENPEQIEARQLISAIDEKNAKDQLSPKKLKPRLADKVTLEFRDANLRNIFEVIAKTSGINFVLDPNLRPDLKASVFVKDASVEEVVDFLVVMHQLGKKVLTENSILIYPQSKSSQYEELILRTFYLNHADAKQTVSLIKSMMPVKDAFVDEKLNMISLKATFEQMKDIERLIVDEDIAEPEVLLDVEVLEVRRSRLTEIGVSYPDTLSVLSAQSGTSVTPTWRDLQGITADRIGVSPLPSLKLLRLDGDNNLLANPRIRVKNREKAKIHIGDKIPIPVTTVGSGNNNFVGQSANYLDVGLKLDVEPKVMLNNDVSIKLTLEVSNATFPSGSVFPTIGTRNTSTVLMTGDGETQILAGLINDEERKSTRKVPGIADIPLLGRLFSSPNNNQSKTEIVLLITPHVVRNIQRPEAGNAEFYAGTGARNAPLNMNPASTVQQNMAPVTEAQSPASAISAPTPTAASANESAAPVLPGKTDF